MIAAELDLKSLRTTVAVVETGSFRAAARALGYTQSAISHQIAAVERRLQTPLFLRPGGRKQVTLTPIGELVYQHAQRLLAAAQALDADVAAARAGELGELRVAVGQSIAFLVVEPLAALRGHSPGIEVSLHNTGQRDTVAQQLSRGELDLALFINAEPDERMATAVLLEDEWVIVARDDDPIAQTPTTGLDALDGADMIAWHARWPAQASLEQLWRQRRIRPRIVYRTDDSLMVQRLVAGGLGYACVGGLSVQQLIDSRLRHVAIRDETPKRTLSLCWARERELSVAALFLINAIRTATGNYN